MAITKITKEFSEEFRRRHQEWLNGKPLWQEVLEDLEVTETGSKEPKTTPDQELGSIKPKCPLCEKRMNYVFSAYRGSKHNIGYICKQCQFLTLPYWDVRGSFPLKKGSIDTPKCDGCNYDFAPPIYHNYIQYRSRNITIKIGSMCPECFALDIKLKKEEA